MSAFSYQYHPFLVDPAFIPNTPIIMSSLTHHKQSHINTTLPSYHFHLLQTNQQTSSVDHSSKVSTISDYSPESSMVVDKLENGEQVNQNVSSMEKKKRRIRNGSPLIISHSKESREGRNKKQKKRNDEVKEEEKPKEEKKVEKEGSEEPPKGYIHVRARRGQATDSHSLAERVRREKISERMNMLQKLVPGCDKVTGKALMLDEIINYVQSLQNQVEFLSMKLASVNPMFFNLAIDLDLDTPMVLPEKLNSIVSPTPPLSYVPQCSLNQSSPFADTTTIATNNNTGFHAANDYLLDYAFLQEQRSTFFSEYSGGQFWDVEDQRQKFLSPYGFGNDSCSLN
ncbi:hypothetical protein Lal_00049983 [Lupinus albus]|uniref:Putative transcription factor bHLH family n=1 Tax=Lupinus albus TaxID=3870 RepID=A0A6A5LYR5_LUPAL|nr:putative transcription factor bHLH family [Lupinus albus]KAF1867554.1 hypothetical protein Lal_00049983 [Lupinus albus]